MIYSFDKYVPNMVNMVLLNKGMLENLNLAVNLNLFSSKIWRGGDFSVQQ
jgi:hypothetical protein